MFFKCLKLSKTSRGERFLYRKITLTLFSVCRSWTSQTASSRTKGCYLFVVWQWQRWVSNTTIFLYLVGNWDKMDTIWGGISGKGKHGGNPNNDCLRRFHQPRKEVLKRSKMRNRRRERWVDADQYREKDDIWRWWWKKWKWNPERYLPSRQVDRRTGKFVRAAAARAKEKLDRVRVAKQL